MSAHRDFAFGLIEIYKRIESGIKIWRTGQGYQRMHA